MKNRQEHIIRLMLPYGNKTTLAQLEKLYEALLSLAGNDKIELIQKCYQIARGKIENSQSKSQVKPDEEGKKEEVISSRIQQYDTSFLKDEKIIQKMVSSIKARAIPKEKRVSYRFRQDNEMVFFTHVGTMSYRALNTMTDTLEGYELQFPDGKKTRILTNTIDLQKLSQDQDYCSIVLKELLNRNRVEVAQEKNCGYIGRVIRTKTGEYAVSSEKEDMNACIAYDLLKRQAGKKRQEDKTSSNRPNDSKEHAFG